MARGAGSLEEVELLSAEIEREWAEQLGEELVARLREAAERIAALEGESPPSGGQQAPRARERLARR